MSEQYNGLRADANSAPSQSSPVDVIIAARRDRRLTGTRTAVLCQVATDAQGSAGTCWTPIEQIAEWCHLSESTTRRALAELVDLGWLVELREAGRPTVYRVNADRVLR